MKILISGADGFIGKNLCDQLLSLNHDLSALLLAPANGAWKNLLCADLSDERPLDLGSENFDTIIHLAGKAHAVSEIGEGQEYFALNTNGTQKLLEAAKKKRGSPFRIF